MDGNLENNQETEQESSGKAMHEFYVVATFNFPINMW